MMAWTRVMTVEMTMGIFETYFIEEKIWLVDGCRR